MGRRVPQRLDREALRHEGSLTAKHGLRVKSVETSEVYKGQKANIDSYSAFFDNCKANDTGLTKQLEDAGVTDVYCLLAHGGCQFQYVSIILSTK